MTRAELFPTDRRLTAQMALALVLTPILVIATAASMFLLCGLVAGARGPRHLLVCLGVTVLVCLAGGLFRAIRHYGSGGAVETARPASPELQVLVDRLSSIADVSPPRLMIVGESQPNSWLVNPPGRRPRLLVTQALLDLLDSDELAAVFAHELGHLVNRDALVMTIVGMPRQVLGGRRPSKHAWFRDPVELVSAAGTSALSRYRELAADRMAAVITGRPSELASALMKVSGAVAVLPAEDLRRFALRDSSHFVAVGEGPEAGWLGRFAATHPPLERRLAALDVLEHSLQHARRALG
jgi:heat shock protein HtpX